MSRKKLLLLFILSFLCVIYTLNNICYKHFDNKLDTIITQNRLIITDTQVINNILEQNKVIFISDGVIEEQGTPEEVFDAPKSEKTRAFLSKRSEGDGKAILDDDGAV